MLIPVGLDELKMLEMRYGATRFGTRRFALTIVTSLGCNFDCPYCLEAKHPSIMNAEVQAAVLQVLEDKLPTISSFTLVRRRAARWQAVAPRAFR